MMRKGIEKSAIVLSLLLAACAAKPAEGAGAGAPATAQAVHPVSGLRVVDLSVTSGTKVHRFRVEVAATSAEQMKGLMFRTEMGADEGMIFPMDPPRGAAFWMKNTVIPLDIIFVGPDGRITNIAANAVPYSLDGRESTGLAMGVLELNGGRAAQLGIAPGDKVEW
jgi:uncharacterized membrane protein (UPF0127 family)